MLMTLAPWSAAHLMLSATTSSENCSFSALEIGRILAPGAMPSAPPCLPVAAMIAAIPVPWPSVSVVPSVPLVLPNPVPGSTCPARSGCFASTPESITATTTPSPRA